MRWSLNCTLVLAGMPLVGTPLVLMVSFAPIMRDDFNWPARVCLLGLPRALAVIPLLTITIAAVLCLLSYIDAVTSRRTMGLGREWMGYLQGRPGRTVWPYEQTAGVRFESVQVAEKACRFMFVAPHEGCEVAFGLADDVDVCEIAGFLADKGVEVSTV